MLTGKEEFLLEMRNRYIPFIADAVCGAVRYLLLDGATINIVRLPC
ncbi:MAG: hypothetical protein OXE77_05445 [Flavobacteriaceae bacterium]|nr:hypothetical protein [Flavobacteriaceae bacterium]